MARFASAQGSQTEAINAVADVANQVGGGAYEERTAGAVTLTPAQMINGIIKQGGTPGAFNMTTASAAALVAAIKNCQVGSKFEFALINGGDNTVTIVAGTGVTLKGTTAVPTAKTQVYRGVVTNAAAGSEAVTFVGLLTAPV